MIWMFKWKQSSTKLESWPKVLTLQSSVFIRSDLMFTILSGDVEMMWWIQLLQCRFALGQWINTISRVELSHISSDNFSYTWPKMSRNRLLKQDATMLLGKSIVEPEFKPAIRRNNAEQYYWQSGTMLPQQHCCILFSTGSDFWPCRPPSIPSRTTAYSTCPNNYTLMLKIHRPFITYHKL